MSGPRRNLELKARDREPARSLAACRGFGADVHGDKESRYHLVEVADAEATRAALASVLGITIVVAKARRLFIHEGVRIHLDRVEGLGDFIEFEGVAAEGEDPARFVSLLEALRRELDIRDGDLVSGSYSDLLISMTSPYGAV